jgi:hypothetical protein
VLWTKRAVAGDEPRAFDHVAKLAHVARPRVRSQEDDRIGRDLRGRVHACAPASIVEQRERQRLDVFRSLPKRRDPEREAIEAVVEIPPERPPRHLLLEIAVRRGQEADVDRARLGRTHARYLTVLDHAQELRLHRERELSNFVEEHGAAIGRLENSHVSLHGASERAAFVAEELALQQRLRQDGAVDADERFGGARRVANDRVS